MPKDMHHSLCKLRFLEFEADFVKKHKELLKTVENLTTQLNERVTKLVRIFLLKHSFS
jgi:hypothetical protein